MRILEKFFLYSTILFQTIIALWSILKWNKVQGAKKILILLFVEISLSSLLETVASIGGRNNLWVIHISTLCEFILIVGMFILWKERKGFKRALFSLSFLFVVAWFISKWTFEPLVKFDSYTSATSRILEMVVAMMVLFDVLRDTISNIRTDPRVWVASGIIIYSAGSLFMVALFNQMLSVSSNLIKMVWPFNWLLSVVAIALMARGLACQVPHRNVVSS